ncbi:MAG: Gfo/Idh/MocA family protein [Planctomycetota bacterium]|jgi:predicted dehydrogenase
MKDVLRIGMIGCGGNGRGHLKALSAHPESEVVALTDPARGMIARARREIPALADVPAFADHRKMLAQVELDAVAISTPHTQHTGQIIDALNAGLHVLCEKPLTCSVADTKKVIAKARAKRRKIVVAYQRRWQAMRRFSRSFIRSKEFGKPLFVQSFLSQGWLWGTKGKWRQKPELSGGGQLNDSGSHLVDMIFWTMPSRPVEVSAMIENRGAKVDIDSAVSFRFADGCLGNLSILGAGPGNVFWEDLTIAGSGGQALFLRNGQLTVSTGSEMVEYKSFGRDADKHGHFIDVVKGRARNESPPEEFLPNIAFTQACWKSAAAGGRPVKIKY